MLWDFNNFNKNDAFPNAHKNFITNKSDYYKEFLKYRGVFSMSENLDNELLWVHYTNETGYCVEYNTNTLLKCFNPNSTVNFRDFFYPISYPKSLKQIDFNKYIIKLEDISEYDIKLNILYCLAVKENHWKYENEWRLLLNREQFEYVSEPIKILSDTEKEIEKENSEKSLIGFDKNIIEKIILAPRFFNNDRFNKYEENGQDINQIKTYFFKTEENGGLTKDFLNLLKDKFPNQIFQINKNLNKKKKTILRDLTSRIEILEINNNYVKIKNMGL